MSEKTGIEWADSTWSPWRGCTKVSTGCAHCYAETLSKRNTAVLGNWGKGKPRVLAKNWNDPVKWHTSVEHQKELMQPVFDLMVANKPFSERLGSWPVKRPRVFPSLCDWLDDEVDPMWLFYFLTLVLRKTPNLEWLLLTKRPELFRERILAAAATPTIDPLDVVDLIEAWVSGDRIPLNVWIGTSVEDQANADRRIPARLRFLSVEPLLGPVDLDGSRGSNNGMGLCWDWTGNPIHVPHCDYAAVGKAPPNGPSIDWVIVGGESGHGARPCDIGWIRDIVRKCATAGVPCFVKQLGAKPFAVRNNAFTDHGFADKIMHPKGGDPDEWPEDLRVRQMPEVKP